ncbi:MAG: hypothetical protein RR882_09495 [Comamonas sp.]
MFTLEQSTEKANSPSLAYARVGVVLISLWYCSMGWLATLFADPGHARAWVGRLPRPLLLSPCC